ncbi:menin [Leptidea sinapis]|uniref:menin n=1 Tax=Leptidea sinapis TaxID=189913 RepID=UPI0021451A44|nr:menin [Leptidea sinapis]
MASINEYKRFFPIDSISKVCELFEAQLRSEKEPDLSLFSILVGAVENNLTNIKASDKDVNLANNKFVKMKFPSVSWEDVKSLYDRFSSLMKSGVDSKLLQGDYSSRDLIKRVADVVWNSLTRSYYKDRAHLQSIYSFLTGNKLDCFGVAFAVTAGCQILGKRDVHLALSEDHAWVVFGKDGKETAEVTWHGKGNEDKRGRSVGDGVLAHSWLYVAGKPVVCTRIMELAALVSSINPTLTPTIDVHEVALLQYKLLWLLYTKGHLDTYPMALGNLADLEIYMKTYSDTDDFENFTDDDANDAKITHRPDSATLYLQAIRSARTYYDDRHVYPYTFQGGYYHRHKMYKEAFHAWACAGDVIRHYNYSRDDEEIYKEFSEIANELIPQLMKAESSGHSARSILKDPECFASLLRFYDGICKWEEGSQTPILHIGWAKPLVSTISKFDAEVRAQVNIVCDTDSGKIGDETKTLADIESEGKDFQESNDSWNNKVSDNKMSVREQLTAAVNSRPKVTLYSHKMAALKPLLLAERLNTHALQLQLTAQSQLQIPHTQRRDEDELNTASISRAKRARRER